MGGLEAAIEGLGIVGSGLGYQGLGLAIFSLDYKTAYHIPDFGGHEDFHAVKHWFCLFLSLLAY